MRILKIYDGDYPWDVRVEKITQSLLGAGHEVRLLGRNLGGRPRSERAADGLEIVRLPTPAALSFPFPLNPVWWQQIRTQIRAYRPERILVRDLPLAPIAVAAGRRAGIPVIADLAEPYPDSLRSQRQFQRLTGIARWIRNPAAAEVAERYVVRRVDRALVVCPEAGQRLERQGLLADRWTEVGNTPRLDAFAPSGEKPPEIAHFRASFVIFFAGLLAGDRGLDVALEALSRLEASEPGRFGMVIIGAGPMRETLIRQAEALRLSDRVLFPGFVPHERLPDWITNAQLGLLPFHTCPHINSTLANKLFEFMALGLPVVASDVPPMRRILEETGAGLLFRSGNPEDLARAVREMASDAKAAVERGEAGARAARGRYHWGVDESRLLEAIARP